MAISVARFGTSAREMVGVLQVDDQSSVVARYLLCRPLGQEAARTAPVFRVLADRLAREDCASLRFDYHGTGDSPGDEWDQHLDAWVSDILTAHDQLAATSNVPVHWFGMGLGATMALAAALRSSTPPTRLVLWNPVMDGKAYISSMLSSHREDLSREFGYPWARLLKMGKVTEPTIPGDVLGFDIGQQLANDLNSLKTFDVTPALERGVEVICAIPPEERTHFGSISQNGKLRLHAIETPTNWMLSEALGTAIVPADLLRTLMTTLDK